MVYATILVLIIAALATVAALILRHRDEQLAAGVWRELAATAAGPEQQFDPKMVANLPDAARRYFHYTKEPGTPLSRVVEIAPHHGFVWRLSTPPVSGSDGLIDGRSWTRFRLIGLLPVVRAGGGPDHLRFAVGRAVAEGAFWCPGALLPGPRVRWEGSGPDRARVTLQLGRHVQSVEITVAETGEPRSVVMPRWSNANAEKTWRLQPFGGDLSAFRNFGGYRLPTTVEGGNHYGTRDYFPFYKAQVRDVRMLPRPTG